MQTRVVVANNSLVENKHKNRERLLREDGGVCEGTQVCEVVTWKYQRMRTYIEIHKCYTL